MVFTVVPHMRASLKPLYFLHGWFWEKEKVAYANLPPFQDSEVTLFFC